MPSADLQQQLKELTKDLLYISESENPLEVLDWAVTDEAALVQQIASFTGVAAEALQHLNPTSFFASIQMMADPADEYMTALAKRYKDLHDFLDAHVKSLEVIRAGEHQVHIFLAGFPPKGNAVVLHTLAVET